MNIELKADPDDIERYESLLYDYESGRLTKDDFVRERLQRGIYVQRQPQFYMVRTKLTGGALNGRQLRGLAEAVERYSRADSAHITTRQDIQLYNIALDDTPALLHLLACHEITTREAGGNTVRNVTTCALSGACPHERVDVEPFARALAAHFVNHPLSQSLPRKFKITLSGCDNDCAHAKVHDLGFIATLREGEPGFKVLVGGGLGAKPRKAVVLEPFIEESLLLPVAEAVLALHDQFSDRERRTRSRLKFLLERFGEDEFRKKYRRELARIRFAFEDREASIGEWHVATAPRAVWPDIAPPILREILPMAWSEGMVVPVRVPGGDLSPQQLRVLADLLDEAGCARMRCTQSQDLLLLGVPKTLCNHTRMVLADLGLGLPQPGEDVVGCPGTDTCPLGITASARVAKVLVGAAPGLAVRVSGCQNGCAQAEIADIGLIGKARRHHGQMVPSYTLRLGGGQGLGLAGPDIPAARIPSALKRISQAYREEHFADEDFIAWSHRVGQRYFRDLLRDLVTVSKSEITFLIRDQGDSAVFRIRAVGMGECAGSRSNPVDKLLLSAAYESTLNKAFAAKQKYDEAGDCLRNRLRLTARALLLAAGGEERSDETLAADLDAAMERVDVEPGTRFSKEFGELDEALTAFIANADEVKFPDLLHRADLWTESARSLCRYLQAAKASQGSHHRSEPDKRDVNVNSG